MAPLNQLTDYLAARQYLEDFGFPQWDPTPIGEDNAKTSRCISPYHTGGITRENQMEFKTINVYRLPTVIRCEQI